MRKHEYPKTTELVRVPVAEEIWTTLDGRHLAVADMSEDHVRNALRHVIHTSRYTGLYREMRRMGSMTDLQIDLHEWMYNAIDLYTAAQR